LNVFHSFKILAFFDEILNRPQPPQKAAWQFSNGKKVSPLPVIARMGGNASLTKQSTDQLQIPRQRAALSAAPL
jgi:hypothetical protein